MGIEETERKLLEILKANGDWMSRRDISRALGHTRLYPNEITLLDVLARQGVIEARSVATKAPSGERWEYRAKRAAIER